MLTRPDCRHRDFDMQPIWRGDVDQIDVRVANELVPVTGRPLETELLGRPLCRRPIDIGEHRKPRLNRQIENSGRRAECNRVSPAHVATTDQTDGECVLLGHSASRLMTPDGA